MEDSEPDSEPASICFDSRQPVPVRAGHAAPPVRYPWMLPMRETLDIPARRMAVLAAIAACAVPAPAQQPLARGQSKSPVRVEALDAKGNRIAGPVFSDNRGKKSMLAFDHFFQPGDRLLFSGPRRMALRVDETIPECLIYAPQTSDGGLSYEIPYGRAEKETGSAYAPESFSGSSHRVGIRVPTKRETFAYRNLALNPCDLPRGEAGPAQFFPHASSNSVSRSLFDFEARNAIDGRSLNGHHGVWPYQSWGPQLRTDIWWKLDFGRPVELNKIRVMVRADFPHDSYWKSAAVEFSDESSLSLQLTPSADFQDFSFSKRRVSWLRITNVVPADPSRWCSFVEVEAWGKDLP